MNDQPKRGIVRVSNDEAYREHKSHIVKRMQDRVARADIKYWRQRQQRVCKKKVEVPVVLIPATTKGVQ